MKKITITLAKGIQLKEELEKSIKNDNSLIENMNLIDSKKKSIEIARADIERIETDKEIKSELLIIIYTLIQECNSKKTTWGGKTNFENIKRLSEFQGERSHLMRINTKIDHNKKGSLPAFTFEEVNTRIRNIEKETIALKEKMTNFNNATKITLKVDESLIPILEEIGIK